MNCLRCGMPLPERSRACPNCGLPAASVGTRSQDPQPYAPQAHMPQPNVPHPNMAATVVMAQRPRNRRTKEHVWVIVGISIAAAVFLTVAVVIGSRLLHSVMHTPQSVAHEYLSALSNGEFGKANGMAPAPLPDEQTTLLTDEARPKTDGRITNIRIREKSSTGDTRVYMVTYTLLGKKASADLTVARQRSGWFGWPSWKISSPLTKTLNVAAPQALEGIMVNGVRVSATNAQKRTGYILRFAVYPGVYEVSAVQSKFYTTVPLSRPFITVGTGSEDTFPLNVEPTEILSQEIGAQMGAALNKCAEARTPTVKGCPFGMPSEATPSHVSIRNVSWSVKRYPEFSTIAIDSGEFLSSGGAMRCAFEYRFQDSDPWRKYEFILPIRPFGGTFTIRDGKVSATMKVEDDSGETYNNLGDSDDGYIEAVPYSEWG